MFPDKLLSSHFWSESQKKELTEKSLRRRQDSVLKLSSLRKHPSDYNSSNFEEISAVDLVSHNYYTCPTILSLHFIL